MPSEDFGDKIIFGGTKPYPPPMRCRWCFRSFPPNGEAFMEHDCPGFLADMRRKHAIFNS